MEIEPAAAEAAPLCPASPLCPLCPAAPLCPAMLRPDREDTCCDDDDGNDAVCSASALLESDLDPTPFDDDPLPHCYSGYSPTVALFSMLKLQKDSWSFQAWTANSVQLPPHQNHHLVWLCRLFTFSFAVSEVDHSCGASQVAEACDRPHWKTNLPCHDHAFCCVDLVGLHDFAPPSLESLTCSPAKHTWPAVD